MLCDDYYPKRFPKENFFLSYKFPAENYLTVISLQGNENN